MAKFQGGVEEIAKAIALMPLSERKVLLSEMAKRDPSMAKLIESKLYSLEDLRYITSKMMADFLREIKIKDLGISLKLYPEDLKRHLCDRVSKSMKEELIHFCENEKIPLSKVEEIHSGLLGLFRRMIDKGSLIISKSDTLV